MSVIGEHWMTLPDYSHAYLRASSASKEYFIKKKIEVKFGSKNKEEVEILKLAFTKVFKIKKDKKTGRYYKDWNSLDLRKTLWMEIKRRGIIVHLRPHIYNPQPGVEYYLESPLFDNRLQLSNEKPEPLLIQDYEIFKWFDKHGLSY